MEPKIRNFPVDVKNSDTMIFFLFFFSYKGDFPFFFHIFLLLSLVLNILLSYMINTNGFSPYPNPKDLVYKPSLDNITIFLSRLVYIGKNKY